MRKMSAYVKIVIVKLRNQRKQMEIEEISNMNFHRKNGSEVDSWFLNWCRLESADFIYII